jgi:dihydroxyacetone kinase-like protein
MKKLINDPFRVTAESVEGYARTYPDIVRLVSPHVVASRNAPVGGKVGVVIGG